MKIRRGVVGFVTASVVAGTLVAALRRRRRGTLVFIGTHGGAPDGGVHMAVLDERTGAMAGHRLVAATDRPTWLLADGKRRVLYAVSEVGNTGDREGAVLSYAVDSSGALHLLGRRGSGAGGATHLSLDRGSDTLFVANFGGGPAAALPIASDGSIGDVISGPPHSGSGPHRRQKGPHPHGVTLDPTGRFLLVPDMGTDQIYIHRFDPRSRALAAAQQATVAVPAGAGPRLILFGRDGRFAYMLSELSAELFVYRWDPVGRLDEIARVPLDPPGTEERSAAALAISADGRFLYASNRRTHSIHVFAIDHRTGQLRVVQQIDAGGEKPWAAELSPSGRWLLVAANGSDRVVLFAVDRRTGQLTATGRTLTVPTPTGFAFLAAV
jgi:6-phosphogluconolactonase